jgi:hypothetical protein
VAREDDVPVPFAVEEALEFALPDAGEATVCQRRAINSR